MFACILYHKNTRRSANAYPQQNRIKPFLGKRPQPLPVVGKGGGEIVLREAVHILQDAVAALSQKRCHSSPDVKHGCITAHCILQWGMYDKTQLKDER